MVHQERLHGPASHAVNALGFCSHHHAVSGRGGAGYARILLLFHLYNAQPAGSYGPEVRVMAQMGYIDPCGQRRLQYGLAVTGFYLFFIDGESDDSGSSSHSTLLSGFKVQGSRVHAAPPVQGQEPFLPVFHWTLDVGPLILFSSDFRLPFKLFPV
jgi:hypothetical protein